MNLLAYAGTLTFAIRPRPIKALSLFHSKATAKTYPSSNLGLRRTYVFLLNALERGPGPCSCYIYFIKLNLSACVRVCVLYANPQFSTDLDETW